MSVFKELDKFGKAGSGFTTPHKPTASDYMKAMLAIGVDAHLEVFGENIRTAINKFVATGAPAGNNITVTGIDTADNLLAVIRFESASATTPPPSSKVSLIPLEDVAITGANTIQISNIDTSADRLLVIWEEAAG